MPKFKLTSDELIIGKPLPWDVYTKDCRLFLNSGFLLSSEKQKALLLCSDLYRHTTTEDQYAGKKYVTIISEQQDDPLATLKSIKYTLASVLLGILMNESDDYKFVITELAKAIQKICADYFHIALGTLILNQNDLYTHIHPMMCSILTERISERLEIPELERRSLICAALTQNIGMFYEQEKFTDLQKPLTEEQHHLVFEHPRSGYELLQSMGVDDETWLNAVLMHHERIDGEGYPNKLAGTEISVPVRILSLTDLYSAMVLPRQYRDGLYVKQALRDIFLQRGKTVDLNIATILIKEIGIYPPGVFVKLANGETAIVVKQNSKHPNSPQVISVMDVYGNAYESPKARATHKHSKFNINSIIPRVPNLKLDLKVLWQNR